MAGSPVAGVVRGCLTVKRCFKQEEAGFEEGCGKKTAGIRTCLFKDL